MKVTSIGIKNILGIEELHIKPVALNVISCRNAAGKSSVLEALRNLAEGGHDPSLIRQGSEQGSVGLVLDDGVSITKTITPEKSTTVVRHEKFGKISKPQEWIRGVLDGLSLDPIQFLTAKAKDRVDLLLAALPLKLDPADLDKAVPKDFLRGIDPAQHPLKILDDLRGRVYAQRRDLNVTAKEKRATVTQMEDTLPEAPEGGDWRAQLEALEKARETLGRTMAEATFKVDQMAQAEVANLKAQFQQDVDALREAMETDITRVGQAVVIEHTTVETELGPQRDELNTRMGEAEAQVEAEVRAENSREIIARFQDEALQIEASAIALSVVLSKIDVLKESMLKNLPIKGLEFRDGEIYVDGVPFDRVNDAEKHRLAVEVGKLKAGELGLMLIDRGEIFDAKSWASFTRAATESGLQIIAARVADEDLTVRSASEISGAQEPSAQEQRRLRDTIVRQKRQRKAG